MSNTFGHNLRVTVFGQSHASAIGAVIDGLPAGMKINMERVEAFMKRRAPGWDETSTARREADTPRVISGLNERGETCGAPLCAVIENTDARPGDYESLRDMPRPGHADYPAFVKYHGHADPRGGGAFSGRMTAPLCFAGAVCMQVPQMTPIIIAARVASIGGIDDAPMEDADISKFCRKPFPTIDDQAGERMRKAILEAKSAGDSVGGVVELVALNVPVGLGEPMFDGMENRLSAALFAIPGVRGVEFGAGFAAARMRGSEHNDEYHIEQGRVVTRTNRHGGVLGGITSGMPIVVRVAFKPTPSIALNQNTVSLSRMQNVPLAIHGRHDPCIVPRALPVVEAMAAIVIADLMS